MSLDYKVYAGLCPDERCQTKLYFAAHKTAVECSNCGQRHSQHELHNIEEVTDGEEAITQVLKSIVWDLELPKKGSDSVKVHGLSNYHCKLLSPLFTHYGMDKAGNPRLLSELGHGESADCGRLLCNRTFLISPEHINIVGYGKDQSGSVQYLQGLLDIFRSYHDGEELLIPIHADGDGHCLVHALSRATTGREIFWHALRDNLMNHLERNLKTYQELFRDFIDMDDWRTIIEEADPYHMSPEGFNVGLGNIHIFALANVLKRPIVLLDSLEGMKNVADYTAVFVPALVNPGQCRGNIPLCIAWSGAGHNHFIPLVGVAGRLLPSIPQALIPNIWGIDKSQAMQYLTFNNDGSLTVAGGKPLQKGYLLRLVSAIERVFLERHLVSAELVSDMHLYVYQRVGFVGLHPDIAVEKTRDAVSKNKVFRCLLCNALSQAKVDDESLRPGGLLYNVMLSCHGTPRTKTIYSFPMEELQCKYDPEQNCLVPYQFPCAWCKAKKLRRVDRLGNMLYVNGDPTKTPSEMPGSCCGYKHYWNGREYDNLPHQFAIVVSLRGKSIEETVTWFHGNADPTLNSDSGLIAQDIAEKYFGMDDVELTGLIDKITSAIETRLKDLDLAGTGRMDGSFGTDTAKSDFFHTSHNAEMTEVPYRSVENKPSGTEGRSHAIHPVNTDAPSTSKRVVMKREADGTMKPPSPTVSGASKNAGDSAKATKDPGQKESQLRIRVSTSDGRQETLWVATGLDYSGLEETVQHRFSILPSRQVLKLGFPPKLLEPNRGIPLGLQDGDRITVEIRAENASDGKNPVVRKVQQQASLLKKALDSDKDGSVGTLQSFVDLLQVTMDKSSRETPASSASVDAALSAVSKMVKITGRSSVWEYATSHPELFLPGGAFYEQFSRDIGLIHGRHCMLPLMPGRVFRYNGDVGKDRIELCLEPTGHFQIGPGITDIIDRIASMDSEVTTHSGRTLREAEMDTDQRAVKTSIATSVNIDPSASHFSAERGVAVLPEHERSTIKLQKVGNKNKELGKDSVAEGTSKSNINMETKKPESKMGPGFTAVGPQPTEVTPEEAGSTRQKLMEVLKAKKHTEQEKL